MREPDALPSSIRVVEREVLDRRHLDEALLQRDQRTAFIHLLRAYAHAIRDIVHGALDDQLSWTEVVSSMNLGLDRALRWATAHCPNEAPTPTVDCFELDGEAQSLIRWAINYVKLTSDHTAASRKLYKATIDEDTRLISFEVDSPADHTILLAQRAAERVQVESLESLPLDDLTQMLQSWLDGVDLSTLRTASDLPDVWQEAHQLCYPSVRAWIDGQILPELDGAIALGACTIAELRKFWAHLYIASRMMTDLERRIDRTLGNVNEFGSVILEGPTDELCSFFSEAWNLSETATRAIVDLLTFNPLAGRDSLNSSIFLRTSGGLTQLVCWMVVMAEPGKIISLALARKSKDKRYDSLITTIEQRRVVDVTSRLVGCGLVAVLGRKLKANGTAIHPDFWLYEPLTSTLLACDYKHALPPFGPADVANRLNDLECWRRQIRKYASFVQKNGAYITKALALPAVKDCTGLILLRWPMPIPTHSSSDIIVADWPTLQVLLDHGARIGIDDLRAFYQLLRYSSPETSGAVSRDSYDITVGEWTYRHPVFFLSPPQRSKPKRDVGA